MEQSDSSNLAAMRRMVSPPIPRGVPLVELVNQLLKKRDALVLVDNDWYDALTQHIVTLDSAATFEPSNEVERIQLDNAINVAVEAIQSLIGEKLMK